MNKYSTYDFRKQLMGTFDIKPDAPGQLRAESLNINIKFERTGPTTGRVSWNIPTPSAGCSSDTQAYCGMLVTIDNTPASGDKIPTDGAIYTSDPTADVNLFAGDMLGTAKIIGAFYEDRTTTFLDIVGLTPNTPYYVSGFPTDCQYRYHKEGVHAYSLNFDNKGTTGTSGSQIVLLDVTKTQPGVNLNDFTGLMPGITYDFQIQLNVIPKPRNPVDPAYCNPAPITYTIRVNGTNATTYSDLINEINKQLSLLDNSVQGPFAPNTGTFYWDGESSIVYQWNGTSNDVIPAIIQPTNPTANLTGSYWLNPTTTDLKFWNGSSWIDVVVINSDIDPKQPIANKSYWYSNTLGGHYWNGVTWCSSEILSQNTDPSSPIVIPDDAFWINTTDGGLYKWDNILEIWVAVDALQSEQDPSNLLNGTYWFDESSNTLNAWNIPSIGWNEQYNVSISEREPTTPAPGKFWYNPTTQILKQWNALLSVWNILDVLSYPSDPAIRSSCDLWWNTLDGTLFVWDTLNTQWVQATHLYDQSDDPNNPITFVNGTMWYNPDTKQLYVWNNNCFNLVEYVDYPTDPTTILSPGVVWHNTTLDIWLSLSLTQEWETISPTISLNDPSILPVGTYWFNTTNNSLQSWNGVSWISVLFTTTNPKPTNGTLWFDTNVDKLKEWNGISWILAPVKATVELDCHGNMLFTDTSIGSLSFVKLTDITLFKSLSVPYIFNPTKPGTDGISSGPSYNEIGVGTDGSVDERLQLMTEIRYELGYPVVDVELTNEQLDYAISKALSELRAKSGIGYKRGFFFMATQPETQRYLLTNKVGGFNKIVDILGIQRLTSSFLSSAHGAGVYGQIVLQHLYNMGTFDLLSYHIMAEYTKTMEILFAARLTYTWNEQSRELWIHHRFPYSEPYVSVEASVERTEQDIMTDRYSRPWVRRYATAVARLMLAEIRGKYSTLPGAGGGVTLNANDLRIAAKEDMEMCLKEIEDFLADNPDQYGMATTFIFG